MKTQHKTMRLTPEVIEKIKAKAKEEGRSFNNMVQRILELAVK